MGIVSGEKRTDTGAVTGYRNVPIASFQLQASYCFSARRKDLPDNRFYISLTPQPAHIRLGFSRGLQPNAPTG